MSVTATTTTQRPATAATESREPDEVEYPEGHWTAQSVWHGDAVMQAAMALRHHFRGREDVLVAMELVIYYKRGDNTARLQPDVQVVFGVGRGDRGTYKVWEEGKAPDFVLEVASPSTAENDARYKAGEYAGIGVREYWRLDPKGSLMERPLEGYEMTGGRYKRVAAVKRKDRGPHLRSRGAGPGPAQPEAGRGNGAGVPRPADGGRVRRRPGGSRAASAGCGGSGECRGGSSAGIGGTTPEPHGP